MITLLVIAGAAAAVMMPQASTSPKEVDPLIGGQVEKFPQPAELHAKLRSERRDSDWAPAIEEAIRKRVIQIPLVGKNGNVLRVTCASDLCEIAGTLIAPASKEEQGDRNSQFSRTVETLQVPPLTQDLMHLGLKVESGSFLSGQGKPDRLVYLLYYSRTNPKGGASLGR